MYILKKPLIVITGVVCLLWGASTVLVALNWNQLPRELLFISQAKGGGGVLYPKNALLGIVLASGVLTGINLSVSNILWGRDGVLSLVLLGGTVLFLLFTLVAVGATIAIN